MVALDDDNKPARVAPLAVVTEKQKLRFAEAKLRRELARKITQEHKVNAAKIRQDLGIDE